MQTIIIRSVSESFALNQWLVDAPCDMSYQEIIDCLNENPDTYYDFNNITTWELIEGFSGRVIANYIEDTKKAFERAIKQLPN